MLAYVCMFPQYLSSMISYKMECVLLEVLLNLCWIYLCLICVHKSKNTQTYAYACIKGMDFPVLSSEYYQYGKLCTTEKSQTQRLNALACLSSAQSENQQTKARQFRARSVILPAQSSSYNKVVTVLNLLRASATVPKPWSHFCRKSLGKILFDLLWPQCHPLRIFQLSLRKLRSECSTFFRVSACRGSMWWWATPL